LNQSSERVTPAPAMPPVKAPRKKAERTSQANLMKATLWVAAHAEALQNKSPKQFRHAVFNGCKITVQPKAAMAMAEQCGVAINLDRSGREHRSPAKVPRAIANKLRLLANIVKYQQIWLTTMADGLQVPMPINLARMLDKLGILASGNKISKEDMSAALDTAASGEVG
jgi:hypothetical protein